MSIQLKTLRVSVLLSLFCGLAQATVITSFTDFLLSTSPTQTGRLSRNAVPQDWANDEVFPGVINTTINYHYQTYSLNVGNTPFIQIEVDSLSTNTFISAYDTAYAPTSLAPNFGLDTNWLGDAGTSGNYFGTDPIFFQVVVPAFDNLIIVVNQTATGTAGLGSANPFAITVEGFIDSEFTDPSPVPEPTGIVLSAGGLLLISLAGSARRWSRSRRIV